MRGGGKWTKASAGRLVEEKGLRNVEQKKEKKEEIVDVEGQEVGMVRRVGGHITS